MVHPLVLLSVVDHYNRVAKDTKKRVVGVLLGENSKGRVEITNSFAGVIWRSLTRSQHGKMCLMARNLGTYSVLVLTLVPRSAIRGG